MKATIVSRVLGGAALVLAVPSLCGALPAGFEDSAAPAALVSRIRQLGSRSSSGGEAVARDMSQYTDDLMVIWDAEAAYVRVGNAYGGFKADLEPDYRTFFPGMGEEGLSLLKGFKFHMTADESGDTTVTTEGSVVPEGMQEALDSLTETFGSAMSLVLQEWSGYHSVQFLPQIGEKFRLARDGNSQIIDFHRGDFDYHVTLSKNKAFVRLDMASSAARRTCSPTFMTTEGGFLYSSSECTIVSDGKTLSVKTAFDYQTASGLKLPSKVDIYSGVNGGKPPHLVLSLKNVVVLPR